MELKRRAQGAGSMELLRCQETKTHRPHHAGSPTKMAASELCRCHWWSGPDARLSFPTLGFLGLGPSQEAPWFLSTV